MQLYIGILQFFVNTFFRFFFFTLNGQGTVYGNSLDFNMQPKTEAFFITLHVPQQSRIEILVVSSFNLHDCPFTGSAGVINS